MKAVSSPQPSLNSHENPELASLRSLGYSLRRYFVDEFHFRHVPDLKPGSLVLDLGGNRVARRGFFNIEAYDLQVVYANLSSKKMPDVRTEASCLPFKDNAFDGIICSELLEHVSSPPAVLREIHRVLQAEGSLLICVPFLNRIHADPYDFGRYTEYYWLEALGSAGFSDILIEKQGFFWCVLMDMIRDLAYQKSGTGALSKHPMRRLIESAVYVGKRLALKRDRSHASGDTWHESFTTGFGIKARKL